MITDRQVRKLRNDLGTGMTLATAAVRAGMSEKIARKYRNMTHLPSEARTDHTWRTRTDPFESVWPEVQQRLKEAPDLQAKTISNGSSASTQASFSKASCGPCNAASSNGEPLTDRPKKSTSIKSTIPVICALRTSTTDCW